MSYRPWWNLEPCGTDSAYKRHLVHGELTDQACRDAHAAAEAWRCKRRRGEAVTLASAREAALRRAHAEFARLLRGGMAPARMPLPVQRGERDYQRNAKRRQRRERQRALPIVARLHSEAEMARLEVA